MIPRSQPSAAPASLDSKAQFVYESSDFKAARLNPFFVDKTLFIKEIIDDRADVRVILRPPHFGKTFNLSMLKYFFEKPQDEDKKIESNLFEGLAISRAGERYKQEQGKYPVIFMSFKDISADNYAGAYRQFQILLSNLYKKYKRVLFVEGILEEDEKTLYQKIIDRTARGLDTQYALRKLISYLERAYNTKVIVLIDEYDLPLQINHMGNDHKEIVNFIECMLETLKENSSLKFSVLTGIFCDKAILPNNRCLYSPISHRYSAHFGFTEAEVKTLINQTSSENREEMFRYITLWYGGYQMGQTVVYNPWLVTHFIANHRRNPIPVDYSYCWSSNENALLNKFINSMHKNSMREIENDFAQLSTSNSIPKLIYEQEAFTDILAHNKNIWSFLFLIGYLTIRPSEAKRPNEFQVAAPNQEFREFYKQFKFGASVAKKVEQKKDPENKPISLKIGGTVSVFAKAAITTTDAPQPKSAICTIQ